MLLGKRQFCRLDELKKVPPTHFHLSWKKCRHALNPKNIAAILYKLGCLQYLKEKKLSETLAPYELSIKILLAEKLTNGMVEWLQKCHIIKSEN